MAMEIKVGFEQTAQTLDVAFSNAQVFNSTYIPPIATTDEVGLVKPDGETITISEDGTITATAKEPSVATTETAGIVKPDGSTITVDADGTIHAVSETVEVVQTTGDSETAVMSQKAVTDALANVGTGGGGDIIDLTDQYVRIWNLDTGIYRLTYDGDKYLYYSGTTATATVNITADKPIIYVNSLIQDNKEMRTWISITAHQSTSVRIASGYTNISTGTVSYFNPSSAVSTGMIVNNLNYSTSNQSRVLSAYQGYVLDQRLQAVENLLAGVGVAEEGEF